MLLAFWLQVILAIRNGEAFIGYDFRRLPIGTYTNLIVLIVATPILALQAFKHWR